MKDYNDCINTYAYYVLDEGISAYDYIARLTDYNQHTEAVCIIASIIGDSFIIDLCAVLIKQHNKDRCIYNNTLQLRELIYSLIKKEYSNIYNQYNDAL